MTPATAERLACEIEAHVAARRVFSGVTIARKHNFGDLVEDYARELARWEASA